MHRRTLLSAVSLVGGFPIRASSQAFGRPSLVQIGSKTVQVPTPAGFVETSRRSPALWNMALAFEAGDTRLVANFVAEPDLKAFEAGLTVHFRQFMLVQTPRHAEGIAASQAQFDRLVAETLERHRILSAQLEPRTVAEVQKLSNSASTASAGSLRLRPGDVVPVSVDRTDKRVLLKTALTRSAATGGMQTEDGHRVLSSAYCLVRGKVVMLVSHRQFRSPKDLQDARALTESWAGALIATN